MDKYMTLDWEGLLIDIGVKAIEVIGILIAFVIVKKIGRKVLDRTFLNMSNRKNISEGRALTLHRLAENILSYSLTFILAASLFNTFGLPVASLIAGAGVVGLAIGFGAQGLVSDVVTGFFLLLEKQLDVNDYVTIGSIDGVVEEVGLRTTKIRSFDGTLNYIPNRGITTVMNHSRGNMRALVDITIAYDEDVDHVIEVTQSVCDQIAANSSVIVEGPNVIGVQAFGTSDVVLRVIAKTENGEQWAVEREIRKEIKAAFTANALTSPSQIK